MGSLTFAGRAPSVEGASGAVPATLALARRLRGA